ncbi:DUF397 domain-containing protein, partial [Streptomyces albogriseolus]|uniref:DUF397 domain-containing protein n=1 Tax=Streptomyces albogriseolus TaxID=1887 RepID=UPI0036AF6DED
MNTEQSRAQLHWFKSSYSGGAGGECLEVAASLTSVHVRDSKDTGRGAAPRPPPPPGAPRGAARAPATPPPHPPPTPPPRP